MLLTKCECVAEDLGLEQGLVVAKLMNYPWNVDYYLFFSASFYSLWDKDRLAPIHKNAAFITLKI
jgi:hypothetical protein